MKRRAPDTLYSHTELYITFFSSYPHGPPNLGPPSLFRFLSRVSSSVSIPSTLPSISTRISALPRTPLSSISCLCPPPSFTRPSINTSPCCLASPYPQLFTLPPVLPFSSFPPLSITLPCVVSPSFPSSQPHSL